MPSGREILWLDDDARGFTSIAAMWEISRGAKVTIVDNIESAIAALREKDFDWFITDGFLAPSGGFAKESDERGAGFTALEFGIAFACYVRAYFDELPITIFTAAIMMPRLESLEKSHGIHVVQKTAYFSLEDAVDMLDAIFRVSRRDESRSGRNDLRTEFGSRASIAEFWDSYDVG